MQTVPVDLLAPFASRELATSLVPAATGLSPIAANYLVLTLDAVSAAVVRTAGMSTEDAQKILSALWQSPPRYAEPQLPAVRPRAGSHRTVVGELAYRGDLGQRIHVVRRARRLTLIDVQQRTGILNRLLRDVEAGTRWPTALQLYRLAQAFDVPVPLLVDPKATPLRVLRLLSGQVA